MKEKQNTGITLIALVITIIALLILAGVSISMLIGENGILGQAEGVTRLAEFAEYKDIVEVDEINDKLADIEDDYLGTGEKISLMYNIYLGEEIKEVLPDIAEEDIGKIAYIDDELVYIVDDIHEDLTDLKKLGYETILRSDLDYYIELKMIENLVGIVSESPSHTIGKNVGSEEYEDTVFVAGIAYAEGWAVLGDGDSKDINTNIVKEIEEVGIFELTEEEKAYFKNSPYVVTMKEDYVVSLDGKNTNVGTNLEAWKYSYNYNGETDGYILNNVLTAVTAESVKTQSEFGQFTKVSGNFIYEEDKYGNEGLVLGQNTASTPIDEQNKINQQFTVSVVVEGDTMQNGTESPATFEYPDGTGYFGKTVLAISNTQNNYTVWMSIIEDKLRVYVYGYLTETTAEQGFISIDISEYDEKYMNIQLTAERGGNSNIYINGELKVTFPSGKKEFLDTSITIGDLRPGRNLKYEGTIYDVVIYGKALTEEEIQANWNYVSTQFKIDETGTQK